MRRIWGIFLLVTLGAALLAAAPSGQSAASRFPSSDPNPRVGTPNDPRYDCAEPDDEDAGTVDPCESVFDEQYRLFGFAPDSTKNTATYKDIARLGQGQVSGVGADRAWKRTIGRPDVVVAILDTGIEWDNDDLRRQVFLNPGELPFGAGPVTIADIEDDPRISDTNENEGIDGQDVIRAFSDGRDDDNNGYVDDIAGWDFFDDDNDPDDVSSYSSADGHGSGRAEEAVEEGDDGTSRIGVCPRCRFIPLREWDSFVVPGDAYAMATAYAADIGAAVTEVANGVLQNTRAAKAATRYAFDKGVVQMHVSSDLNTTSHNYPTNYRESIFVNGCVADGDDVISQVPGLGDALSQLGLASVAPVATWFRQSNLTQHGAHAHVCMMGTTGSEATGQAAGAAALLVSLGRDRADELGGPLTADEVKQVLTMSAEDVLPQNTVGFGVADPAAPGWDEHFGYGRADLGAATKMIADGRIPPEAWIDGPAWWALLDPTKQPTVDVVGHVSARRAGGATYELAWGTGVQPTDFHVFGRGSATPTVDGVLGQVPLRDVAAALPGSTDGAPPDDPNTYTFTVRLRVTDADGNVGEDRKAWFAFHDPTLLSGWPRFVDTGGESSMTLYDLDGDGSLEVIEGNSSGELSVTRHDGTPLPSFNRGRPFVLPPTEGFHPDQPAFRSGAVPPPTGGWRTPAVFDVDGDLAPEIVAAGGDGRVYVLDANGAVAPGFPVSVDPALSAVARRTKSNHVKRGIGGAPVVADLDGDGTTEIVASALDGYLYVWSGATGAPRPGFPLWLKDPAVQTYYGGEIISTPTLADLDGNGTLEIVVESGEVYDPNGLAPPAVGDIQSALAGLIVNLAAQGIGKSGRIYAVRADGSFAPGWPVPLNGLLPDILPFVVPGHNVAAADVDGDGDDEVIGAIATGDVHVLDGDGSVLSTLQSEGTVTGGQVPLLGPASPSKMITIAEWPIVAQLDSGGLDVAKGALDIYTVANLLLTGQNLPHNHVLQSWDTATGLYRPGYPRAIDDFQIVSSPAAADVGGPPGRELIAGSALYLIHAFGAAGQEAPGFPKLAGGWVNSSPAVGDIDGDGDLDLVAGTREGWRFAWDLGAEAPATAAANSEWWTESHDECHTGLYGHDCRPPAMVRDLRLAGDRASWSPSGDDWKVGRASSYQVRASAAGAICDIAGWTAATPVDVTNEGAAVLPAGTQSVAVIAVDDAGNRSALTAAHIAGVECAAAAAGDEPMGPLPATGGGRAALGGLLVGLAAAFVTILRRRRFVPSREPEHGLGVGC